MNTGRPTHAAGAKWFKWQDPIIYRDPVAVWLGRILFWLLCIDLGAAAGALAR